MKAVSPLLSHMTSIAIGLVVVILIILSLSNLGRDVGRTSLNSQLNLVLETASSQIIDSYSFSKESELKPLNGEEIILQNVELNIPERLANDRYNLKLTENALTIRSGEIEITRNLKIDIDLEGEALPPASLQLKRNNANGVITDKIVLVD